MKKKNNLRKDLRDLKQEQVENHENETKKIADRNRKELAIKIISYNELKKLLWYHYLLIFSLPALIIGFSFIVGIYWLKNDDKINWIVFAFFLLGIVVWFFLGWYKNHHAALYYNDSKKRYSNTYTDLEAKIRKIRNITFFIDVILLISWLIIFLTI